MAINLVYQPDGSLGAQVAQEAGRGAFLQEQAKYGLQRDQLAAQQDQFNRRLGLEGQLALLRDRQSTRALRQRGYLAQQELAARQQMAQFGAANDWERMQAQMTAQQEEGQADRDFRGGQAEEERKIRLSERQQDLKQKTIDKQFSLGLASAENLERMREKMLPEEWEQARSKWDEVYGTVVGAYPFDGQQGPAAPVRTIEDARTEVQSMLGDAYRPGDEKRYYDVGEDGEVRPSMAPKDRNDDINKRIEQHDTKMWREEQIKATIKAAEITANLKQEQEEAKAALKQQQDAETSLSGYAGWLNAKAKRKDALVDFVAKNLEVIKKPDGSPHTKESLTKALLEQGKFPQPIPTFNLSKEQFLDAEIGDEFFFNGIRVRKVNKTQYVRVGS